MTATTGAIEVVTAPARAALPARLRAIRAAFSTRRRPAALAAEAGTDAARRADAARLLAERERARAVAEAARVQRML